MHTQGSSVAGMVVTLLEPIADDVMLIELAATDGPRLPDWEPGAHIDLVLPNGLTRQYSLCGDRWRADRYRIAVLREVAGRGGSEYVHKRLQVGDAVGVGGPRNHFRLAPADSYLFIAGGIGITPLLPMIEAAQRMAIPWRLLYGGRRRGTMAFLPELEGFGAAVTIVAQDESGHLPIPSWIDGLAGGTRVYCCGPGPLLDAVTAACHSLAPGTLRTERFTPQELEAPARTEPFRVHLARSNRSVTVEPGQSILSALGGDSVRVLTSCRQGTCGTCATAVLSGRPEHRDSVLTDDEREAGTSMMVCVSRSFDDELVLDL